MRIFGILMIGALAAVGCTDDDDDDVIVVPPDDLPPDDGGDELPPPSNPRVWEADLIPTELYGTIGGTATVESFSGEQAFTAGIFIDGDIPGMIRPWHVHVGACPGGSIVGPDDAYPRVIIGDDGTGAVETNILQPLDDGAYSINVHYSDAEFSRIIACGDLIRVQ